VTKDGIEKSRSIPRRRGLAGREREVRGGTVVPGVSGLQEKDDDAAGVKAKSSGLALLLGNHQRIGTNYRGVATYAGDR